MALVSIVSTQITPAIGDPRAIQFYFPSTLTLAQAQAFLDDMAGKLDSIIGGVISEASVTLRLTLPEGIKTVPTAGYRGNQGGLWSLAAADTTYAHDIFIPTVLSTLFVGNEVDRTNATVLAVEGDFLGAVAGSVAMTDRYANQLDNVESAVYKSRK